MLDTYGRRYHGDGLWADLWGDPPFSRYEAAGPPDLDDPVTQLALIAVLERRLGREVGCWRAGAGELRTDWKTLSTLLPYLWDYKGRVLFAIACLVAAKVAVVGVPVLHPFGNTRNFGNGSTLVAPGRTNTSPAKAGNARHSTTSHFITTPLWSANSGNA
jgi:hypothetical protein